MDFFLDTADIAVIKALLPTGLVDGITTNPTLVHQSGQPFEACIKEIASLVNGPISAEVIADDAEGMIREGKHLASIASNVVVKVPLTIEGLKACKALTAEDIDVNVTLCFSVNQAILAAKAGATFVSPFVGRLEDISEDGLSLLENIAHVYNVYGFHTHILAASLRSPFHVMEAAKRGCDAATIPPKIFEQLVAHPLTDKGVMTFKNDWAKTGQTIGAPA